VICPTCHAQNDPLALACFHCESPLTGHAIRRGMVIGGRYEILKWLGRGGMGTVYEAYDRVLEEEVAVKVLRAEVAASNDLTRRFRSEIKLARRVRQPNVCAIHEYGEDGDLRFISMELIVGTDLKRLIQESGRLDTNEAFNIARQIAEGLKAIHAIGVIHRDLKTANIMLDDRRLVHVMDFGIAKQFGPEASGSATVTGHILGTPEYMSPEQARGEPLDPRTDIYALGIVMFEIFTGDVPFHGDTPVATLFKQLQDPPPVHDPRLPRSLSAVLEKALAKDAGNRYANVADLIEDLDLARQAALKESAHAADMSIEATVTEKAPVFEDRVDTAARAPTFVPPPTMSNSEAAATVRERIAPASTIVTSGITFAPAGLPPAIPLSATTLVPLPVPRPAAPPVPRSATPPPVPMTNRPVAETRRPYVSTPSNVRRYALAAAAIVVAGLLTAGGISRLWESSLTSNVGPTPPTPTVSPPAASASSLSPDLTADSATVGSRPPSTPQQRGATPEMDAGGVTRPRASAAEAISPTLARDHTTQEAKTTRMPSAVPAPTVPSGLTLPPHEDGAHPAATSAPAATPAPVVETTGLLQIVARPWAEVSVDGSPVGTTPFRPLKVAAGPHTVIFTHPDYKPFRRQVTVRPGETARLEVNLTWEAFRK
jgi:serine/threonine protein kinase